MRVYEEQEVVEVPHLAANMLLNAIYLPDAAGPGARRGGRNERM